MSALPLVARRPWAAGALGVALLGWLAVEVRAARGAGDQPRASPRHWGAESASALSSPARSHDVGPTDGEPVATPTGVEPAPAEAAGAPAGAMGAADADQGTRDAVLMGYAAALVLAPAAAVAAPGARLPVPPAAALVAGIGAIGGGLALRLWSIRTLDVWFTYDVRVRSGQPVVDSGPYRVLRHPSYTGALLCAGGYGLALGNAVSVGVALAAPLVGTLRRIRVEEDALRGELGAAYESYCQRTSRLLPGVW